MTADITDERAAELRALWNDKPLAQQTTRSLTRLGTEIFDALPVLLDIAEDCDRLREWLEMYHPAILDVYESALAAGAAGSSAPEPQEGDYAALNERLAAPAKKEVRTDE